MLSSDLSDSQFIKTFFELTLAPERTPAMVQVASFDALQREEFLKLAQSHHVVIRCLQPVYEHALAHGHSGLAEWSAATLNAERARIDCALQFLHRVCVDLDSAGCPVTVIKSLDHTPDLGNDLDLYTCADPRRLVRMIVQKFNGQMEPRSWGDRLANKWNFNIPGLPELMEFHVQRLGQTGEHTALAKRCVTKRVQRQVNGLSFFVPAPEERIVAAVLQRMYRHFYFRVCDVLNSAALVDSGSLDFAELQSSTEAAGIWTGVATYLEIVSGLVAAYRGEPLQLPPAVRAAARFGSERVSTHARFLRIPVVPEGASLFVRQVASAAMAGDLVAALRLNLLPPLALAAALAYRVTGSDKGIW